MKRIIFSLPEDLFVALQRVAREEKRSVAAVLRDAAQQKVATRRPKPLSVGVGYSDERDIARRIGDEFGEVMDKDVRPTGPVPRSIGIASSGEKNLARSATEEQFVADPFRCCFLTLDHWSHRLNLAHTRSSMSSPLTSRAFVTSAGATTILTSDSWMPASWRSPSA